MIESRVNTKYWLSTHPTLIHAPATLVSHSEDDHLLLRADEDGHETEVEAPGCQLHESAL